MRFLTSHVSSAESEELSEKHILGNSGYILDFGKPDDLKSLSSVLI